MVSYCMHLALCKQALQQHASAAASVIMALGHPLSAGAPSRHLPLVLTAADLATGLILQDVSYSLVPPTPRCKQLLRLCWQRHTPSLQQSCVRRS